MPINDQLHDAPLSTIARRTFLSASLLGGLAEVHGERLSVHPADGSRGNSCFGSHPQVFANQQRDIALAFFSRAGENYFYGDRTILTVGNTDILAGMISDRIGCDTYRIEAEDPYSDDYDATVARNVQEQDTDARPAITHPLELIDQYDTILLGSPIWNVRPPRIMMTFAKSFDFATKQVFPFTTHAMSGLGTAVRDYTDACPGARIGEGLAVRGEEVSSADPDVDAWLHHIGLLTSTA